MSIVAFATLAAVAAGPSSVWASDATTTDTYLHANYALMQYADAHIRAGEKVLAGVSRQIGQECPQAAAESPQDPQSTQLSNEVIGTMVTTVVQKTIPVARGFVRKVSPLHWSNGRVNRAIHSYAAKVKVLMGLSVPHLCADVKAWAASAFKTLPAATTSFERVFYPAWVGAGELPASLQAIAPASDRALIRGTIRLEEKWAEFEAREVETWGDIMDGMGLHP